jgi:hypothetical protein
MLTTRRSEMQSRGPANRGALGAESFCRRQLDHTGMTASAYVRADPVNGSDPTGTARVCSTATGTRIQSCVSVDGDGDGEFTDHDMTSSQQGAFARSYAEFLHSWGRDQNLSPYGKRVEGDATEAEKTMVRVTSQFVGWTIAHGRSTDDNDATINQLRADWSKILHIEAQRNFNTRGDVAWLNADHRGYWIGFAGAVGRGDSRSIYNYPSDLARVIFHEILHIRFPNEEWDPQAGAIHRYVDSWARDTTVGVGFGRCQAASGFPGCR